MNRPRIGVTGPARGGNRFWAAIAWNLRRAGAEPVRLTSARAAPLESLDGLVISGGSDIDPVRYGHHEPPSARLDGARDEFELALLNELPTRDVPVLGICRGAQLLNVHAGGALHPDLKVVAGVSARRVILPRLRVRVEPESQLATILGRVTLRVNAFHHQAMSRLGAGLRVAARDDRGVIQAVEAPGAHFRIGVQWHPELLPQSRIQRRLFSALADAARDGESAPPEAVRYPGSPHRES